ncbi:MAG: AraC family transcriptional regulator [Solobacterium sp.]|nr:AraC family transcriptional regulator [Solobacterium sp.]
MLTGRYIEDSDVVFGNSLTNNDSISGYDLQSKVLPVFYDNIDRGLELYDISYDAEEEMIRNIESGNIEALSKSFSANDAQKFGSLADTTVRSTKNMFIVVVAIASRVAIRNGLSVQIAYKLSDLYIQEIEQTSNFRTLTELVRNATIDYAQRIKALRIPKGMTSMVHEGMQYIEQSVTQPLSVSDVADYVGKSVSYFSGEFKKETGMNVSTYITQTKIEEGKRLLKYTDLPLSYISNFLCFSSQSHFQKVFKSVTGLTPLAYRTKKHSL